MKKLIFVVLVVPLIAFAGESQPECIRRVEKSLMACSEVCSQVMDNKRDVTYCEKECGQEAREKFIDECKVPLKRRPG